MAAKKAPAKKPSAKDTSKFTSQKPKAQDGRMRNRTDKAGSSGMGMTKGGVEARAKSTALKKGESLYPQAGADFADYTNLRTGGVFGGTPKYKGKKITDQQADKIMLDAANAVRKKYGVKPKKK